MIDVVIVDVLSHMGYYNEWPCVGMTFVCTVWLLVSLYCGPFGGIGWH